MQKNLSPPNRRYACVIPRHRRWRWGSLGSERVEDANRWTDVHRGMTCLLNYKFPFLQAADNNGYTAFSWQFHPLG